MSGKAERMNAYLKRTADERTEQKAAIKEKLKTVD